VTGYRTEDERAFNAGAAAFLLKPFDDMEFRKAAAASRPFKVLWVCPYDVRNDWTYWAEPLNSDFQQIQTAFAAWLAGHNIPLDVLEPSEVRTVTRHNVIILDYFGITKSIDCETKLIDAYLSIRSDNPDSHLVIILPMRDDVFEPNGGMLHTLGDLIRDGQDLIFHKPMWFFTDSPNSISLGQRIIDIIRNRPRFDVKYVVLTPLLGMLWGLAKGSEVWTSNGEQDDSLPADDLIVGWSPLGVLLGEIHGFTFSLERLAAPSHGDPKLGIELSERLRSEWEQNTKRWQGVCESTNPNAIVARFLTYLANPANRISPYQTIERWLRDVLNKEVRLSKKQPENGSEDDRGLTEFLTRLFGGETRFEFGAKGGWYDPEGNLVQDTPLVIEFCARKGILAREAIERVIVNYLKDLGGEEMVLFQEIPIRGFMR